MLGIIVHWNHFAITFKRAGWKQELELLEDLFYCKYDPWPSEYRGGEVAPGRDNNPCPSSDN
jgi:hypothetical protein